ncbi:MAG: hypothetical protein ACI8P3_002811 [Saprospiraceae bacterium]|jgi:hypothetical protein
MKESSNIHPICIASPTRRSGTTLLQRLLSSASNALIYGETCANDFNMLCNLLSSKEMLLSQNKDWHKSQLQSVLQGEVNKWIPDLMPEIDGYLQAYKNMILSLADHYGSAAGKAGRPIWGMKMPEWYPVGLLLMQKLMPGTKILYLHRNLKDCVRSAKKIEMVIGPDEIQRFCQTWRQFTDYAKVNFTGDQVMHLAYEELINDPGKWIPAIEKFTGAIGIDRTVMRTKVNTYDNDQKLESEKDPYLQPAVLSEEELAIVSSFSGGGKLV